MKTAQIVHQTDGLAFYSPYAPMLINELKQRVPFNERKPVYANGKFSHWVVTTNHLATLENLCQAHLGHTPAIQGNLLATKPEKQTKLLEVKYIGAPKDRGANEPSAFGFCDGDWSVIFPESVLRNWFEPDQEGNTRPNESTLYGVLVIARNASGGDIKTAYRKMARRFHPDVCKDEDAAEMFMKIQRAYEVLSNPQTRRKYDAGLLLQASLTEPQQTNPYQNTWRPSIRCGWIMAEGIYELGRFNVSKIIQWQDITNKTGKTLVTSWSIADSQIIEAWV